LTTPHTITPPIILTVDRQNAVSNANTKIGGLLARLMSQLFTNKKNDI